MDSDADDASLGEPPEPDPLARAVRRTRIANKLFDANEQVKLGRYQLLEQVGAGGIGVVWGAWDPELERRVAIKLVKPKRQPARDRILLEAQSLAKLSHPNVVSVYDVGLYGEQVYVVMEWVRGETLRAYCAKPRSARDILVVYRAAGAGLHAAHLAGLIHRDFKPENAIVGEDGRVRVLDFGLARAEHIAASDAAHSSTLADTTPAEGTPAAAMTRGAGTPRYMAPEQAAGTALTPAADQYAFCVALREALGAVPSWVEGILIRGTSADPRARYSSMAELLHALARDPRTVWRRRLLGIAAVAVAGGAFAAGSLRGNANEVCAGGAADVAKTWNAATQNKLLAHLRGLGPYGSAEADRLAAELTTYGHRWAAVHHDTCLAHERHEMTELVYERNLGCLAKARASYDTVIEVLSNAGVDRISKAIVSVRGLPAVDGCAFDALSSTIVAPPREIATRATELAKEIERARVLASTDDPAGVAATQSALSHANELGYTPLVARASLAYGLALIDQQQAAAAVSVLERAALAALDAFDDVTFVEANARKIYAQVVAGQPVAAPTEVVERIGARAGASGAFARALLFNNLGTARLSVGDRPGARALFDRSLRETTPSDAELLMAFGNRALVTDDAAERERFFGEARNRLTALLGENHRKTLDVRFQATVFIADAQRAETELREVCGLYRRYHAVVARDTIANCLFELGWLAEARGDVVATRAAMQEVPDAEGPLRAMANAYLLAADGKLAEAAAMARTLGDAYRAQSWARFNAADAYRFSAECEAKLGHREAALAQTQLALELFEQLAELAPMQHYQRRVTRTRVLLARLKADSR